MWPGSHGLQPFHMWMNPTNESEGWEWSASRMIGDDGTEALDSNKEPEDNFHRKCKKRRFLKALIQT